MISFDDEPPAVGAGAQADDLPPLSLDEPSGTADRPATPVDLQWHDDGAWSDDDDASVRMGFGDDEERFTFRTDDEQAVCSRRFTLRFIGRLQESADEVENAPVQEPELPASIPDFRWPEERDFDAQRDVPAEHLQLLTGVQDDEFWDDSSDGEISHDERNDEYRLDGDGDEAAEGESSQSTFDSIGLCRTHRKEAARSRRGARRPDQRLLAR